MNPFDMTTFNSLFTSASLIVAFFGGMVMLFAPCCITLMLPAYLGTVFKTKSRVLLMTLVFAAGVASIMLPIVLGARFLVSFFNDFHFFIFAGGSLLMIGIGVLALLNKTIGLPFVSKLHAPRVNNAASAYALGVISGISSSCCAPVLLGALTLAALSPTALQAAGVGLAYTLGIVFPLLILSLFLEKGLWKYTMRLQQKKIRLGRLEASLANLLSFLVFAGAGFIFLILAITDRNQMSEKVLEVSIAFKSWIDIVTKPLRSIPGGEYAFGLFLFIFLIYLVRISLHRSQDRAGSEPETKKSPYDV